MDAPHPLAPSGFESGPPAEDANRIAPKAADDKTTPKKFATRGEDEILKFARKHGGKFNTAQLIDLFGDHTFLLDRSGLKVLEPSEMSANDVKTSKVVSLADWSDGTLTSLKPHAPEPTGTVVSFDQVKH